MQTLTEDLINRKNSLLQILKILESRLPQAPEGSLRISCSHGKTKYYHRLHPDSRNGRYLPKSKIDFVRQLAQKGYDQEVKTAICKELDAIRAFEDHLPPVAAEDIYNTSLSEQRQALVSPIILPDDIFVRQWLDIPYTGNTFPKDYPEHYTDRQERVRSKSEVLIANQLNNHQIPYKYECPLYLDEFGIVYPDFTVMNVRKRKILYWEHQGKMDDPDYAVKAVKKERAYYKNNLIPGDRLILTSETGTTPLNTKDVVKLIEMYLM